MQILPMPGYLIVKPTELKERTTDAGIIIQQAEKKRGRLEETQRGTVLEICYESKRDQDNYGIVQGDEVIYGEFSGFESDIENTRYRYLEIKDIRAKIIK